MYDTPIRLHDSCINVICDNITALCEEVAVAEIGQTPKLVFKDKDIYFHGTLSEQIIQTLSKKHLLNDEILSLFESHVTHLKRVCINDAQVTTKGLRVLKTHKLSELEITGLKKTTVNDLIGCLGEWTLSNLRTLNVSKSTFVNSEKYHVVASLNALCSLQSLNVSHTEFNSHGLKTIAEFMKCLENLDISCTHVHDITPLRKFKDKLKSLSIYNLRVANAESVVPVLCDLRHLVKLDVSNDFSIQPFMLQSRKFQISDLLAQKDCLPCLTYLDISGKDDVDKALLETFLAEHPNVSFLGLSLTAACEYSMFKEQGSCDLVVTGEASEAQILEALRRYCDRTVYIQKSLYTLFNHTHGDEIMNTSQDAQNIIRLVLPAMACHPKQLGVQMAATACLYNLSKGVVGQRVHPSCLRDVVRLSLLAMENFPHHQQLQKNALLTLCSDRILQEVTFDLYRCAKLVMDCLCDFDDASMNRMSVAICSILAAKISTKQTSVLGANTRYMQKMLSLVKFMMETSVRDVTLKFTLSALWNLTDESPQTCSIFLNEGGLDLFMKVLVAVKDMVPGDRVPVETKILGLLNNIAEVKTLRQALMVEEFITTVQRLLKTPQIDVSYFAAGIVAHLASDGEDEWTVAEPSCTQVLQDLGEVVMSWDQPDTEMVAYRSFCPFFPLLTCYQTPSVQLWAVWAIQHVCTKNGKRYCHMLEEEKGAEILRGLQCHPFSNHNVAHIAGVVLDLLNETNPHPYRL